MPEEVYVDGVTLAFFDDKIEIGGYVYTDGVWTHTELEVPWDVLSSLDPDCSIKAAKVLVDHCLETRDA